VRGAVLAAIAVLAAGCGSGHSNGDWFRIVGESGVGPTLTSADLDRKSARADVGPATSASVVYFRLTRGGQSKFARLSRELAHRGAKAGRPFHFTIRVDGRVVARPYIDYTRDPDGIPADNGLQIDLARPADAQRLAKKTARRLGAAAGATAADAGVCVALVHLERVAATAGRDGVRVVDREAR